MKRRWLLGLLATLLLGPAALCSPAHPNYTGIWKQDNRRSAPQRTGEVTLRIEQQPSALTVETTIIRGSKPPRHALQRYNFDGRQSTSVGAAGDEFLTSIHTEGNSLVFSIEEHEHGRTILWRETWKLTGNGSALERVRERSGAEKQTLIYLRQP